MGLTRVRAEQISDIDYKQAVRVITLTDVTLTVGAPSQVDSVNLSQGDRILVAGQATASQNGIYRVDAVGTGSNGTWIRSDDANVTGEIQAGMIVMITEGTIWKDTSWKLTTNNPITIDSTPLTFVQNTGDSYSIIIANNTSIIANAVSSAITFTPGNNFSIVGNAAADTVTFAVSDTPAFGSITTGNVTPSADNVYFLGNATNRWANLWLGPGTIYITDSANTANVAELTVFNGILQVNGAAGLQANLVSGNTTLTLANSGNITLNAGGSNAELVVSPAGIVITGNLNVSGNIYGNIGNIANVSNLVNGNTTLTMNANGPVVVSPGGVANVLNVNTQGANIIGNLNVSGNIVGNVATANISGNVYAGNVSVSGNVQATYYKGDGSLLTGIAPTVQVYEFANVSSGVSTYLTAEWLASYTPGAVANVSASVTTTPTLITSFITPPNYPGITVLPVGVISAHYETTETSGNKDYYTYVEFYKRTTGGTETLLVTSDLSSLITGNTPTQITLTGFIDTPVSLNATDRIVTKIYAYVVSNSSTITVSFDDNTNSGLQLPALPASIAAFVPYNNATANLALGSFGLTTTGNVTAGNIVNANGNGVGNIGSATNYFNRVFAQATSAVYADLAEMYAADSNIPPGTVVEFGGPAEITASSKDHGTFVAGIISTNPSYLMNSTMEAEFVVPVALTGRVPCKVVGKIGKGDRLVASAIPGVACRLDPEKYLPGCIIGKSLGDYNSNEVGVIEVAVGRT